MVIENPYDVESGLTFKFETILTFHKEVQKKTATVMAYYNDELVTSFFDKLENKLADAIKQIPSKCTIEKVKIEPKEPEK